MPQCKARSSRTGKRCAKSAIKGATVCRTHGGGAPQVRKRAAERLLELVDPALGTLKRILTVKTADDTDKLRAVREVLRHADITPEAPNESGAFRLEEWLMLYARARERRKERKK